MWRFHQQIKSSYISQQNQKNAIKIKTQWPVFLTRVGFRQMPTRLPTWKAKSLYHVGTFLPTWFFLPLQKFKTIKIKWEKNLYTQANTCLLHISRNFKDIFKYIWFTLSLANCKHMTKRNRLYRSSLSAIFFFNRY